MPSLVRATAAAALAFLSAPAAGQPTPVLPAPVLPAPAFGAEPVAPRSLPLLDARLHGVRCDGAADDGPALQALHDRAEPGGPLVLQLPSGSCRIASPVVFTRTLVLRGQGWTPGDAPGAGTWLLVAGAGFAPFTLRGPGVRGTAFEDLAVFQPHPAPPASGAWAPTPYPCVFTVQSATGEVSFRNLFLLAVNRGVCAHHSGRLTLRGVSGQVFTSLLEADKGYDVDRYVDLHLWPYWSQAVPVMAYAQANGDALRLSRVDTPFADRVFVFGMRSAFRFLPSTAEGPNMPGGSTTKLMAGSIACDAVARCLWVGSPGVTWQIGRLMAQGLAWGSDPPAPLPGAAAIHADPAGGADGSFVGQVGQLWTEVTDSCAVCLDGRGASNLAIGVQYSNFGHSPPGAVAVRMTGGPHVVSWASPPQLEGGRGVTMRNPGASGTLTGPLGQLR